MDIYNIDRERSPMDISETRIYVCCTDRRRNELSVHRIIRKLSHEI